MIPAMKWLCLVFLLLGSGPVWSQSGRSQLSPPALPVLPRPAATAPPASSSTGAREAAPVTPEQARAQAVERQVPRVRLRPEDPVQHTFSEGSPFHVWGGNRAQRSNLFTAAGLVRRAMLQALNFPDQWNHPIVLQIREDLSPDSGQKHPVWTTISQVDGDFRIEINLVPHRNAVPGPVLKENLIRALLADQILKDKAGLDLTGAPVPPPDWLLHGTLALMEYREMGRMSLTFSQIFALGRVLSVPDILNADPAHMTSISLTIYRVSCGALLMMLIDQNKGGEKLAGLLPSLAHAGADPAALIEKAYPALTASSNSLSKWWSLQVATLSQPGMEEVQTPAETEAQLHDSLLLRYSQPTPKPARNGAVKRLFSRTKPEETPSAPPAPSPAMQEADIVAYARVLSVSDSDRIFNQAGLALTRLMLRANPLYRPIIAEYQEVVRQLAKGKNHRSYPATLARLATTRKKLQETVQEVENHLDWYEATQTATPSGQFEHYLRAAAASAAPAPRRTDPVSTYLDQVEQETQP